MENSILLVDDESSVLSALKRALIDEPYTIHAVNSGAEGLSVLEETAVKLVISDEKMPGMSGSAFLSTVKELFPETLRIILTGHASIEAAMNAVNNGEIYRFFSKPWNEIELKLAIRSAIEKYDLEAENKRLLKTVTRQADELKQLEETHPGITDLERDEDGTLVLNEKPHGDKDISEILSELAEEPDAREDI